MPGPITGYPQPLATTDSPTFAGLSINGVSIIPTYRVRKVSSTARTSTVTFADDDVLTATLAAGTYHVQARLQFSTPATSSGAKAQFAFSGTKTSRGGVVTFSDSQGTNPVYVAGNVSGQDLVWDGIGWGDVLADAGFEFDFIFVAVTSGTLSVQWAQSVSSIHDTVLFEGSFFVVTPLP